MTRRFTVMMLILTMEMVVALRVLWRTTIAVMELVLPLKVSENCDWLRIESIEMTRITPNEKHETPDISL